MSHRAIAISFVVMLVLAIATPVLIGASLVGVVVTAVALFVATGLVPIVIWAFGSFRARNAIVPIVVWGGLLVLSCAGVLLANNFGPLLDRVMENPEMKKGYIAGLKKSCIDRQGNSAPAATVAAQCDCEANRMGDELRFSEMMDAIKGNQTRAVEQKVRDIVSACQRAAQR